MFILSIFALTWTSQSEAKEFTCRMVTGYGTAIGKGETRRKAKEKAREICGEKLIDLHLRKYRIIDEDHIDDLVLACVNLECE